MPSHVCPVLQVDGHLLEVCEDWGETESIHFNLLHFNGTVSVILVRMNYDFYVLLCTLKAMNYLHTHMHREYNLLDGRSKYSLGMLSTAILRPTIAIQHTVHDIVHVDLVLMDA